MSDLWQARFFKTVSKINELPKHHVPEIAFAGRSNAGKSSVINILCNQKKLAFSSKIPGRTQNLNFFSIGGALVSQHKNDLPNLEFDRWEWYNTIIYQYHIEFFFMFVCFENELGKFERELDEKITFNS